MFTLFCKSCSHAIERISEELHHGETVVRKCQKCGKTNSFFIQYKVVSKIIHTIAGNG